ncbi:hypothetical protein FN846DRAFT_894249 [Sphaerosporella brunnea]|uniref:Uncharacterized protein n=1 Tax=Sphaerosporella brunnea TaxID=1250544 RepID=A0A5J5EKT8_9PEZI|nr:hypothetical protein FN846DRAFT_894249 [Sphaerosporella brunnea]
MPALSNALGAEAPSQPSAQDEDEAMRAFYKMLAGNWGADVECPAKSQVNTNTGVADTLHVAAGVRTLSGEKTSPYTAFLYKRKISSYTTTMDVANSDHDQEEGRTDRREHRKSQLPRSIIVHTYQTSAASQQRHFM